MLREKKVLKPGRGWKTAIEAEDARRKRFDTAVQQRRSGRMEQLASRRHIQEIPESNDINSINVPNDKMNLDLSMIPTYCLGLRSDNMNVVSSSVSSIRKQLSQPKLPPIQDVIDEGCVPQQVDQLNYNDEKIQFEAAWALTNIASGNSSQTAAVVEAGAIPIFVRLLHSPSDDVREQAVWALGNIAGDSRAFRDTVLQENALEIILGICQRRLKLTMLRNSTWTISNLCRGVPQPDFSIVSKALPVVCTLINFNDEDVIADACWALSYLSEDQNKSEDDISNHKIQAVIDSGCIPRLVQLLNHSSIHIKTPALRTIGNIVTGDNEQAQYVLNCNVLVALRSLFYCEKRNIRKETCWVLSNIVAGTVQQIEAVINADLFVPLIEILQKDDYDTKKEAAWAIINAISGSNPAQIQYFIENNVIPPLCSLLKFLESRIVIMALEAIQHIAEVGKSIGEVNGTGNVYTRLIEQCGGQSLIEDLQTHDSMDVYAKAQSILRSYFEQEDVPEGGDLVQD